MAKRTVKLAKRPRAVNVRMKQLRAKVTPEINVVLKKHQELRRSATSSWSGKTKPKFPKFINHGQNPSKIVRFGVMVEAPNARSASISVYRMLNDDRGGGQATKVRRVQLSGKTKGSSYSPKTQVRSFGTFGQGGMVIGMFTKAQAEKRNNGIEARLWDETANDILKPMLTERIKKGYYKGFKTIQGQTKNGR